MNNVGNNILLIRRKGSKKKEIHKKTGK